MSAEDVKRESKSLNLSIKNQNNEEVHFKVKLSTKLHKVFEAYNARKGLILVPTGLCLRAIALQEIRRQLSLRWKTATA
ncbi:hypothetical protein OEZ86_005404 [Tetradesmus obliquus]|nr:hypothetical protein OEZ86_005404 [Tetradesmus obliquus]